MRSDNTTGYTCATLFKGKYVGRITVDGNRVYFGRFDTAEECAIAHNNYITERRLNKELLEIR